MPAYTVKTIEVRLSRKVSHNYNSTEVSVAIGAELAGACTLAELQVIEAELGAHVLQSVKDRFKQVGSKALDGA